MRRIKWENIAIIFWGIFFITSIIKHIIRNGFDAQMFMFEILMYALIGGMFYVSIYSFRKPCK